MNEVICYMNKKYDYNLLAIFFNTTRDLFYLIWSQNIWHHVDYLDRGSIIQWSFTSQDARYNISPEGYVMSLDTGIYYY